MQSLAAYRESQQKTQEQAAAENGLVSKGYWSRLESGQEAWPLRLALRVHCWSGGQVPAQSLLSDEDAQLLRDYLATSARS